MRSSNNPLFVWRQCILCAFDSVGGGFSFQQERINTSFLLILLKAIFFTNAYFLRVEGLGRRGWGGTSSFGLQCKLGVPMVSVEFSCLLLLLFHVWSLNELCFGNGSTFIKAKYLRKAHFYLPCFLNLATLIRPYKCKAAHFPVTVVKRTWF